MNQLLWICAKFDLSFAVFFFVKVAHRDRLFLSPRAYSPQLRTDLSQKWSTSDLFVPIRDNWCMLFGAFDL